MKTSRLHRTTKAIALASAASFALVACSAFRPPGALPAGTSIDEATRSLGAATARYPLEGGATRLEYRQGEFGREKWMLDFDASGRLVASRQVLTPDVFASIKPGMTESDVLLRIGRPAFVIPIGWQQQQVWNYRFGGLDGDCVVFQVSIANASRTVAEAGPNTDPACDHGHDRD